VPAWRHYRTVLGDSESELLRVIDTIPELVTHFYLLTHRDLQHTPRVRAFFDFVVSEIKAFRVALAGQPQRSHRASNNSAADSRLRGSD
jgi:DNA-binding transcriptional LysR family regulator